MTNATLFSKMKIVDIFLNHLERLIFMGSTLHEKKSVMTTTKAQKYYLPTLPLT